MAIDVVKATCEHAYSYGGVKYVIGYQLSGGNAKRRKYYDFYFCTKCLHKKYELLKEYDSTYDELKYGATSFPQEEADQMAVDL